METLQMKILTQKYWLVFQPQNILWEPKWHSQTLSTTKKHANMCDLLSFYGYGEEAYQELHKTKFSDNNDFSKHIFDWLIQPGFI